MSSSCLDLSAKVTPCLLTRDDHCVPPPPRWPGHGHRRTKSAGHYNTRDYTIYTTMGLYAHHPQLPTLAQSEASIIQPSPLRPHPSASLQSSAHLHHQKEQHLHSFYNTIEVIRQHQRALAAAEAEKRAEQYENLLDCGFLSFRPRCIQSCASIKMFVFLSCVLVTLQQALSTGYVNSVITTIEKRFDIPSRVTGAISSSFEIGNLCAIIFVSYLGSHRHIPVWIGKGVIVMAVGSFIFTLPYFIDQSGYPPGRSNYNLTHLDPDENTCRPPAPHVPHSPHFVSPPLSPEAELKTCMDGRSSNGLYILIFMIAQILIGCGGTPIFTLGTTYIDDHVTNDSSSMYIGCMYSTVAFGLVVGYLLGGFLLSQHENSFLGLYVPADMYPGSPKWIGAWWVGFIIIGILLLLVSIPFFGFPKSLMREKFKLRRRQQEHNTTTTTVVIKNTGHKTEYWTSTTTQANNKVQRCESIKSQGKNDKYGKDIKDIPKSMWRLVCNPIYMVTCLGSCMELAIVSGFVVFLPKYLETQFNIDKSQASVYTGGIAIPGACVGIFLGGYLLKKFQMRPKGAIQFVLFFNLLCMGLYTLLYFLGCENMRMAGAFLPYSNTSDLDKTFQVNLTADCNMGCRCSPNDIEPVCGRNGITYFSPCHAGCRTGGPGVHNYSQCACILQNLTLSSPEVTAVPLATSGPCPQPCPAFIPFMILLFLMTLVVSITQMPLLMIILRSVGEEERAFALGMQFVIFRIFGYIPAPIIYGNVIDSACILSKAHCGKPGGFCLLYNIEKFRLRYIAVCSGLKVAAGLLFFLDWMLITWRHKRDLKNAPPLSVGDIVSSIISLDRLSAMGWGSNQVLGGGGGEDTVPLSYELEHQPTLDAIYEDQNASANSDLQEVGIETGQDNPQYSDQNERPASAEPTTSFHPIC